MTKVRIAWARGSYPADLPATLGRGVACEWLQPDGSYAPGVVRVRKTAATTFRGDLIVVIGRRGRVISA